MDATEGEGLVNIRVPIPNFGFCLDWKFYYCD